MARRSLLGHKIRRLRQDDGASQVQMAGRLGISPSYLNLIEHNQRPLTLPLALKISRLFDVDLQVFSDEEEARLVAGLHEVFGDGLFRNHRPDAQEIEQLVGAAPEVCQAVIALYRAYRNASDSAHLLKERLSGDTFLSTSSHQLLTLLTSIRSFSEILRDNADLQDADRRRFLGIIVEESRRLARHVGEMLEYSHGDTGEGLLGPNAPAEEVSDFIEQHMNHFPEFEDAAEDLREVAKLEPDAVADGLESVLGSRFKVRVEYVPVGELDGRHRRYDDDSNRLLLSAALPPESVRFQIARKLGLFACQRELDLYLDDPVLTTPASRVLCRDALARYFAAAMLMPYDRFLAAATELRYDIELLQHRFGASFEQVCHRLTTLRQPGASGVPFHFLRVDIAGNISKRFSGTGLRIPRFGGACPRWNVHAAFMTPGRIRTQIEELPDGTAYLSFARTVEKPGGGYGQPRSQYAIGLGCGVEHAGHVVYADGLDLSDKRAALPIGVTCRMCERTDCGQRAFPRFEPKPAAPAAQVATNGDGATRELSRPQQPAAPAGGKAR